MKKVHFSCIEDMLFFRSNKHFTNQFKTCPNICIGTIEYYRSTDCMSKTIKSSLAQLSTSIKLYAHEEKGIRSTWKAVIKSKSELKIYLVPLINFLPDSVSVFVIDILRSSQIISKFINSLS